MEEADRAHAEIVRQQASPGANRPRVVSKR
jgi:hypothetical protein